jgi:CRP-like cAMP-binding protein
MMISLARNRLLAALPEQDFERLTVGLGSVHLCLGDILYHAGEEIRYVYFPEQGLISLVATMMDGATVETGIVGNEGMMGVPVLLGASSATYRAIVQVEGQAWRMRADAFKYEMLSGGALRKRLLLYTQALMTQMSQMAACNCLHTVEERLCSLLLMIDDRMDSNEFFLTHEMIAEMLGARRAGITVAAGKLRQAGVISYMRGHIHILDRRSLEMWACECYRTIKMEFDRLFEIETESEFEKAPPALQWVGPGIEDRRSRMEDRGSRYSV